MNNRLDKMLSEYAGEPVEGIHDSIGITAICSSELGAYRVAYKYRFSGPELVRVKYSPNLQKWVAFIYKKHNYSQPAALAALAASDQPAETPTIEQSARDVLTSIDYMRSRGKDIPAGSEELRAALNGN